MIALEEKLSDKLDFSSGLLKQSSARENKLVLLGFILVGGVAYKVFLDSGYALGNTFITPYSRRRQLTPQERSFNRYL